MNGGKFHQRNSQCPSCAKNWQKSGIKTKRKVKVFFFQGEINKEKVLGLLKKKKYISGEISEKTGDELEWKGYTKNEDVAWIYEKERESLLPDVWIFYEQVVF